MTAAHVNTARARAARTLADLLPAQLVGMVVEDETGAEVGLAGPFASETAARQWARQSGIERFRTLPMWLAR